jgi:hypothetical protein
MDKHVAERWAQALRSGQYQQGQHELHPDTNSYCCLGVLCDLYRVEQGKGEWTTTKYGIGGVFQIGPDDLETGVLPESVKDWAGMHSSVGEIVGTVDALAALNDEGMEFPQLADLIEKKWEVL